ncbi:MAG: aminotransferase class V-fold PLP-dependent enzyme [Chloroflexi bacterium]|nr:aminotransferase class V-fold PLP-dependent enzyme [Chloroflexota bacterium]
MDVGALRAQIPALANSIYLNTGTFGPLPRVVTEEIIQGHELISAHGAFSPVVRQRIEREGYERTRTRVAQLVDASPDEIALTSSASQGICTIAYGLDWKPGDEVVITDQEHSSGELPWFVLHKRFGVNVRVVQITQSADQILQRFADAITPRTRLVFASHVCSTTGQRLPAKEICALARERNALVALDGAHAVGQFPIDLHDLQPDFYVMCGHKWLLGPQGTAMLFVARAHLDSLQPSWIGWGAQCEYTENLATLSYEPLATARRFEFGTKPWTLFLGLDRAIQFIEQIGFDAIEPRVHQLASQFKNEIAQISGLELITPQNNEHSSGLVSVVAKNFTGSDLRAFFWNHQKILVSSHELARRVRFSVACFNTENEIASALDALRALA